MTQIPKSMNDWNLLMADRLNNQVNLIQTPVITEKSYLNLFKNKQYTFDVDLRLTKPQIKKMFESVFNVQVVGINTHCPPRKNLRTGMSKNGRKLPRFKRVILTLKEGQSLNFKES